MSSYSLPSGVVPVSKMSATTPLPPRCLRASLTLEFGWKPSWYCFRAYFLPCLSTVTISASAPELTALAPEVKGSGVLITGGMMAGFRGATAVFCGATAVF